MAPTLEEIVSVLDARYPRATAESWDHVGLQVGDIGAEISQILFTVDVTEAVIDEALKRGVQLIVSHHPLFFGVIDSLDTQSTKARIAHTLIKSNCALFVVHTNADVACPGVGDALAAALGVTNVKPLVPAMSPTFGQLTYYVPAQDHERVLDAVFSAGAGSYGDYDRAAFVSDGRGQFRPLAGATPAIGSVGDDTFVDEKRVEVIVEMATADSVIEMLVRAHPYEEVAYNLVRTEPRPAEGGHGRVGQLATPMTLGDFAKVVSKSLPRTHHGVRIAGDVDRHISTVAVCGGSGADFLAAARATGADAYLSADFKHHQVQDHLADSDMAIVDVAHWASEWPWLRQAADLLIEDLGNGTSVEVHISSTPTDPWSAHIPGGLAWQ